MSVSEQNILLQILQQNAKKYSRGTKLMDLPLYPIQWDIIQRGVREWLQQKPLKLNYLTEKETKMSDEEINLQIVLGLQTCETKGDVSKLLSDIRVCERKRLLEELEK